MTRKAKLILAYLSCVILGIILSKCAFGQGIPPVWDNEPTYDHMPITNEHCGKWADLMWRNDQSILHPTTTCFVTSWKPVVYQVAPHEWRIYFTEKP